MFRQRLITILILLPIVLILIFYANLWLAASLITLLTLGLTMEWSQLVPFRFALHTLFLVSAVLFLTFLCGVYFFPWLWVSPFLWILIFLAILTYPNSEKYWGKPPIIMGLACFLLPIFAQSLLHFFYVKNGRMFLFYFLIIIWTADISAYLVGKFLGKHKLIPQVSPGKTIEGFGAEIFFGLIVTILGAYYFKPETVGLWFVLSILTILISIAGDLLISMLKRRVKIKDTGQLLPGHGGLLDRMDSLIAAAPFFYWGLTFLFPEFVR